MSISRTKVNYAVVGLNFGIQHLDPILKNPRAALRGCCDLSPEKLEIAAKQISHSVADPEKILFTGNYAEILASAEIDAVLLALPTPYHAEFSIKALEAGKHVFCEKPLAESLDKALDVQKSVKNSEKVFQLGYCVRSSPFHRKCIEIINGGSIGKVTNVWWNMFADTKDKGWRAKRKYHGGKLLDCGCHYLDILSLWAGAKPLRVCAFGNPLGKTGPNPNDIPEVAALIIDFENGVKASYNLSQHSPNCQNSTCGIVGTNGKIEGEPYYPEKAGSLNVHANGGLYKYNIVINGEMASHGHLGFDEQHDVFIDAILKGTPPACSVDEGLGVEHLLHAIDKSITEERVVYLKEIA